MKKHSKLAAMFLAAMLCVCLAACSGGSSTGDTTETTTAEGAASDSAEAASDSEGGALGSAEESLNLANMSAEWTYDDSSDAWTMASVTAVTNPEIEDEQGVSVCVPGAYVKGIDTNGDGEADATDGTATGVPVIDYDASVTSTHGQVYTAATAPVIINTGAAGYSEQQNQTASSTYAAEGYINVACGNRGKQSTLSDGTYTGDAPACLVDQKDAVRFVKYNILLGNLPGSVDYFVSTGGSGGGAHAAMLAATSDNEAFYDYETEAGAVGISKDDDGNYSTAVTINGEEVEISDGMWGCMAYSAITSLYEADMAMAFEYYLDPDYSFNTDFQKQTAEYLAKTYMDYINAKELSIEESSVGFDLNDDGDTDDTVELTIEYDADEYEDTNGYYGTYVDLYLSEFEESLNAYLDRLDYAEDWTWFDEDGEALSDDDVAAMTSADRALAFIEGRYAKGSTGSSDSMGDFGGGPGGAGDGSGGPPDMGSDSTGGPPDMDGGSSDSDNAGGPPDMAGSSDTSDSSTDTADSDSDSENAQAAPDMSSNSDTSDAGDSSDSSNSSSESVPDMSSSDDTNSEAASDSSGGAPDMDAAGDSTSAGSDNSTTEAVGTPDAGTTQSASSSVDSANYTSYDEMLAEYEEDIAEIEAGDKYENDIVQLYNPINFIGSETTKDPTWARILMGASEGDISMFNSLNLEIAWLNAGTDAVIEWQWDGGHVPSEIFDDSLPLYVDMMYGRHVEGAVEVEKEAAAGQTENGTETEMSGTDISGWVSYDEDEGASFSLADAAAYRTAGASKAIPGFDVMDYGQEDYEFGSSSKDARHWDKNVLEVFEENQDVLSELFNK